MSYEMIEDGDIVEYPLDEDTFLACCDCGLIHRIRYSAGVSDETGKDVVLVQCWRDNRRTGQKRRHMKRKGKS